MPKLEAAVTSPVPLPLGVEVAMSFPAGSIATKVPAGLARNGKYCDTEVVELLEDEFPKIALLPSRSSFCTRASV